MTINPFLFGVLSTLFVEMAIVIVVVGIIAAKINKSK